MCALTHLLVQMCALTHFFVQPYIINTLGSQGAAASPQSSVVENPSFSLCFCLPHSIPEGQKDGNLSRAGDEGEQHSHTAHIKDKADMGIGEESMTVSLGEKAGEPGYL